MSEDAATVHRQLLQLHIGQPCELSYPTHYFHTIYGTNIHLSYADAGLELLRLTGLLKSMGRLVLLLDGHSGKTPASMDLNEIALQLQQDCRTAGLTAIRIEKAEFSSANYLAIIGIKA